MHPPHPGRNVDRYRSPAHCDTSVIKDPARASTATLSFGKSPGLEPRLTRRLQKTQPPCDLTRALPRVRPKQKGLLGDRPRRPVSQ
jgi:hypothetical protein